MSTEIDTKENNAPVKARPVAITPRVDILESDQEFLILADMPGVNPDSVSANLDGDRLKINGTQTEAGSPDGFRPLYFSRNFQVPDSVDAGGVQAELKKGVLWLHLPKSARAQPRRIQVTSA